jgi:hypothetical protein
VKYSVELCPALVLSWAALVEEIRKEVVLSVTYSVEFCAALVLGWAAVVEM